MQKLRTDCFILVLQLLFRRTDRVETFTAETFYFRRVFRLKRVIHIYK